MILNDKRYLKQYNYTQRIAFHHIAWERLNFHRNCIFPHNILVFTIRNDGADPSYIRVPALDLFFPLETGHYCLIPCGIAAEYKLTESIDFLTFHFNLEIYPGVDIFSGSKRCFEGEDTERTEAMKKIFAEDNSPRAWFRFAAAVSELCTLLWDDEFTSRLAGSSKYEAIFQDVARCCNATRTVRELADKFGMSKEAFSRKFRQDLGRPPKEFLQQALLQRILARLASPDISVRDIAEELKFSSEFYFMRFFKKQMGITPGEYRRRFTQS